MSCNFIKKSCFVWKTPWMECLNAMTFNNFPSKYGKFCSMWRFQQIKQRCLENFLTLSTNCPWNFWKIETPEFLFNWCWIWRKGRDVASQPASPTTPLQLRTVMLACNTSSLDHSFHRPAYWLSCKSGC
jgi:hypothetical protein